MKTEKSGTLKELLGPGNSNQGQYREQIRKECFISEKTLEHWISNPDRVPELTRYVIADILNVQVDELFTEKKDWTNNFLNRGTVNRN